MSIARLAPLCAALFALCALAWSPAAAQESGPITPPSGRVLLDEDAFRAAFEGRTMHLRSVQGGAYYGSEEFLPGHRSVWSRAGNECQDGVWSYSETTRQICFNYGDGGPYCWYVYQEGDAYYVESANSLLILEIYSVEDAPLPCSSQPMS